MKPTDLHERNKLIAQWANDGVHWGIIMANTGLSKTTIQRVIRNNTELVTEYYKRTEPKVPLTIFQARIDKLSETEKAYLAGLVDGEGSLGLYKTKKSVLTRFNLVTNTDTKLIKYVEDLVGTEFTYWAEKEKWNRQRCCMIQIQHRELMQIILVALLPYLVSKRGKAELVLAFIDERLGKKKHRITDEQWDLVERFRRLNGGNGKKLVGAREYV